MFKVRYLKSISNTKALPNLDRREFLLFIDGLHPQTTYHASWIAEHLRECHLDATAAEQKSLLGPVGHAYDLFRLLDESFDHLLARDVARNVQRNPDVTAAHKRS